MGRILNAEYGGIFGTYYMYYGVICSFCSAFLLSFGYTNSEIGVILAICSIISTLLQPVLADWADRSKKLDSIGVSQVSTAALIAMALVLFLFKKRSVLLAVIYSIIYALFLAIQPLLNSFSTKLQEGGEYINFGVARSCGSLGYALLVAVLGTLVEKKGAGVLPVAGIIILIVLFILLIFTKKSFVKATDRNRKNNLSEMKAEPLEGNSADVTEVYTALEDEEEINLIKFIKRNKLFIVLNVGVIFLYFQNNILNNYMLQIVENAGGNAEDMGRIFSIMAFLEIPGFFLFDKINRRISSKALMKMAAICFVIKIGMIFLARSVFMIYVGHVFQLLSFGIFLPAMVRFVGDTMAKGEAVKGQALYTACITISSIFASVIGGVILDLSGPKVMLLIATLTCAVGAACVCLLVDRIKRAGS